MFGIKNYRNLLAPQVGTDSGPQKHLAAKFLNMDVKKRNLYIAISRVLCGRYSYTQSRFVSSLDHKTMVYVVQLNRIVICFIIEQNSHLFLFCVCVCGEISWIEIPFMPFTLRQFSSQHLPLLSRLRQLNEKIPLFTI